MILYHGFRFAVKKPSLAFCREKTDFGKEFYVTPLKAQAVNWAERFKSEHGAGVVNAYAFLEKSSEMLPENISVLEFDTHSLDWLNFVTACRLGQPADINWDLIIGGVADDKVILTLQLYFNDVISAEDVIKRLRYNKSNFQYCFKNQHLIDTYLTFIKSEVV